MAVIKVFNPTTETWEVVGVGARGPEGPEGPEGPQGPEGPGGDSSVEVARNTQQLNSQFINVKYPPAPLVGAKGDYLLDDGTVNPNYTDDTQAIQNILNSLISKSGTVFFPDGHYAHTGISIPSNNIRLLGAGDAYGYDSNEEEASVLISVGGEIAIDMFNNGGFNYPSLVDDFRNYCSIDNLVIDGNDICSSGVKLSGGNTMSHTTIKGFTEVGLWLHEEINSSHFNKCSIMYNYDGVRVTGVWGSTFTFTNCNIRANNNRGVYLANAKGAKFENTVIESNKKYGLHVEQVADSLHTMSQNLFFQCWFENNGEDLPTDEKFTILIESKHSTLIPTDFFFDDCRIGVNGTQRNINISHINGAQFNRCNILGGMQDGIYLGENAKNVKFIDKKGNALVVDSGKGNDFIETGGTRETLFYGATNIPPGDADFMKSTLAGMTEDYTRDYPMYSKGRIIGIFINSRNTLSSGKLTVQVAKRTTWNSEPTYPSDFNLSLEAGETTKTKMFGTKEFYYDAGNLLGMLWETSEDYPSEHEEHVVVGLIVEQFNNDY